MDRGRQIDNTQNVNARWIDQYNQTNKTSVKIANPPGGKSSFSLGWTDPEPVPQRNANATRNENLSNFNDNQQPQGNRNFGNLKNKSSAENTFYNNNNNNNNFENVSFYIYFFSVKKFI